MGLYLKPMRADNLKDSEGYSKLEAAMYNELERRLGTINYDIMPDINASFLKTKDLLSQYLDVKQFETLAKEHYTQIKGKEWYFIAGTDYNYTPGHDAKADDVMKAAERCLNSRYTTPESWREMERVKLEGMLRAWVNMLPTNVDMAELDVYISNAVQLMNNPSMPEILRDYLNEQQKRWSGLKSDQWRQAAEDWISEALRFPVQDSIRALNVHIEKAEISEAAKERLRDALKELYLKQADEWLRDATNAKQASQGIGSLKAALAQEDIPQSVKTRLERGLENLQTREAWKSGGRSENPSGTY